MNPSIIQLKLEGVAKAFGRKVVLSPIDLEVKQGEFLAILGPSGCGKSTLMRIIAGLETHDHGQVQIGGVPAPQPNKEFRDVALVFQQFTLYPHLSVLDNVTFALRSQGVKRLSAEMQVADWLARFGLTDKVKVFPKQLTMGDRQKVAMVRALVRKPALFLFDEPFGAMDQASREALWEMVRTGLSAKGATSILVTHEQGEAMALGDRVAVMNQGRIEQHASPKEVYDRPANLFVADFVGSPGMNLFAARRHGDSVTLNHLPIKIRLAQSRSEKSAQINTECFVGIRPEWVSIANEGFLVEVEHVSHLGRANLLESKYGNEIIRSWLPPGIHFKAADQVNVQLMASALRFFDKESGQALNWRALESKCLTGN